MPVLFAFHAPGAPAPDGVPCPLDALEAHDAGPRLTVTDEETGATVYAGDASAALLEYAIGRTPRLGTVDPVRAARHAAGLVAHDVAEEWGQDAADDWRCPDADTYRQGPLPEGVAGQIATTAHTIGRDAASADFRAALSRALAQPARRVAA